MLKRLALLGAAGVRRQQRRKPAEHGKLRRGCRRAGADRTGELAQEQDLRGFAGVVSLLPVPGPFGIAAPESLLHGRANRMGIDGPPGFELREQKNGGCEQSRGRVGGSGAGGVVVC